MKEAYVSYEVAKLLKEKGFDWECRTKYNSNGCIHDNVRMSIGKFMTNLQFFPQEYSAPTQAMACRWLREEHSLFIEIMCGEEDGNIWYDYDILPVGENIPLIPENDGVITYEEPEEAIEAALEYILTKLI